MRIKFKDKIYRLKEIESGVDSLMELVEEYKDGDFFISLNGIAFIFDREGKNGEAHYLFAIDMDDISRKYIQDACEYAYCGYIKDCTIADQKAIKIIHDGLKSIGKRWNADKKCVEDIPKRKFKAGDKVRIKDGISSKTHGGVGPGFVDTMDKFIGKELTVKEYSSRGWVVFYEDDRRYGFSDDWLEPWSDEPKVGDWVIFWDYSPKLAKVGILTGINSDSVYNYRIDEGVYWMYAVKWDGTKEHLEEVRKDKI